MNRALSTLLARLERREAVVGVVGLGYVGLPLVRAMHEAGFRVVGFDVDATKVRMLKRGEAYLKHLGAELVEGLARSKRFVATAKAEDLASCDAVCICVPTPLGKHQEPDLRYVEESTRMVAGVLKAGALVVLESTSYPGTTREVCLGILEGGERGSEGATEGGEKWQRAEGRGQIRKGMAGTSVPPKAGKRRELGEDFFLAFSPEREDPGRRGVETKDIPRLVGGVDDASTRAAHVLYSSAIEKVIAVESAEVAEAAKLLENIYRSVNIALVNELKPTLAAMGIDIWSVIRAASTKPFGFQAFYPGPGLGGHCIPIDPFYLTYKAKEFGQATRFIELAGEINSRMPRYVVDRVGEALNGDGKAVKGSRVLVMGIAYKPNVDDVRETPAAEIIRLLHERGAKVSYHDPHVERFPEMRKYKFDLRSIALNAKSVRGFDCVLIVTDHAGVDYGLLGKNARLIVDTRDAMGRVAGVKARVEKA